MSLGIKTASSLFAGFVGAICGNPADISLVRFQMDSLLPIDQRRNYKNIFDAIFRIVKEEGLFTLWRGSFPTILRAAAMNAGMLTTYDEIKERATIYTGKPNSISTKAM